MTSVFPASASPALSAPVEPIAVIGAGCRFPGGVDSLESLWQLLLAGRDTSGTVPEGRWSLRELGDVDPAVLKQMGHGCYLDGDISTFDPVPFGISVEEAAAVDPQHRLFLEVAWEAFEHAGIPLADLDGSRTGVFAGVYTDDYLLRSRPSVGEVNPYYGLTDMHSTMVGRVAFLWNLHGPAIAVDTACSSSLVATHLACQSLRAGETDLALAGGAQLVQTPEQMLCQAYLGMLSTTGKCRSFDTGADGFVRGEGCGVVILKRLADARRDGDRVLAVLRGSAVNHDGRSIRLTAPSAVAQELVFREALAAAGVAAGDVGMVEAHGPGTPVGDPVEFASTAAVYGQGRGRCALGSIKSNIGHTEPASGVAGLLKAILAVREGVVPPTLHFTAWNGRMQPEGTRLFVPTEPVPWPVSDGPRLAAVSGYGVGGTNAQVIVEQPPAGSADRSVGDIGAGQGAHREGQDSARSTVTLLSAASAPALAASAGRLADWLADTGRSVALADVAHTLAVRRSHGPYRLAVVAGGRAELGESLRTFADGREGAQVVSGLAQRSSSSGSPVWVFSGQGSQWARMGMGLLGRDQAFTSSIARLEPLIEAETGLVLRDVLAAPRVVEGFARVQPVLFAFQVSLAAMWRAHGLEPAAVIGHSVGEVAAAVVAGSLSAEDGVKIVCRRSALMSQAAGGGAMAAVQLPPQQVETVLAETGMTGVNVGVHASPTAAVITGDHDQVERLVCRWESEGVTVARVAVDVASHSAHVDAILEDIRAALADLRPMPPAVPFYTTVGADPYAVPRFDAAYWADNLRQPVRFADAAQAAIEDGHRVFVEVSPHPLLGSALRQNAEAATGEAVTVLPTLLRDQDELRCFTEQTARIHCAGGSVDWTRWYGDGRLADVPATAWQRRPYLLPFTQVRGDQGGDADGHPLLGTHLHDLDGDDRHWWQTTLESQTLPWLADHKVEDVAVLPGTGFCEAALASACALYGDVDPQRIQVREVQLRALLPLTAPTLITANTGFRSAHAADWSLSTQDATGTRTVHATARLELLGDDVEPDSHPARVDLGSCRAEHTRPLEVAEFYTRLRKRGIHHDTAFAALRSLRLHTDGSPSMLAEIVLPEEARRSSARMFWHPVLFDACLQALAAVWVDSTQPGGGLALPTELGTVRVYGPARQGRFCLARLDHSDDAGCIGQVQWLDPEGTVLAEATGVRFTRSDPTHSPTLFDSRLLQVTWLPAPLPAASVPTPGRWLLITEPGDSSADDAQALAEQLDVCGQTCQNLVLPLGLPAEAIAERVGRALGAAREWQGVVVLPGPGRAVLDDITLEHAEQRVGRTALLVKALVGHLSTGSAAVSRLWVVTRAARQVLADDQMYLHSAGLRALVRVLGYEHAELCPTSVDIDTVTGADDLAAELLAGDVVDDEVAWRQGQRYRARLSRAPMRDTDRRTGTGRFGQDGIALDLRCPGDLDSFELVPRPRRHPGPDEIEVQVHASGLNFIDVLMAMGLYPSEDPALGEATLPVAPPGMRRAGTECAGTVVAVGRDVTGYRKGDRVAVPVLGAEAGGFCSYVTVPAAHAFAIPDDMPVQAAAGLLTAYLTAWYSLVHLARVQPGDTVLIHSAAGGVGLAALHLAHARGARVLATAGTDAKRAYLRSLGVKSVFDSRNLDFADEARQATGGRGVDIAVNSLTGAAQKATLDLLAPLGRFVELGKKDIYADTRLGLYPFRRNITFHSVDLALLPQLAPGLIRQMVGEVAADLRARRLPVLPYAEFALTEASTAFRTMANAEHIGKLILTWPQQDQANLVTPPDQVPVASPDGSYIITGGLGGLGLVIAHHLADHGAGHIVLNSRRAPSAETQQTLDRLAAKTRVSVVLGDISDDRTAGRLVEAATGGGHRLRGVLHGAAVVEDISVERFDPELLHRVWQPKARGAWNLHQATSGHPLDWWIGFSSIASVFGTPGQAAYAAASAWLDEFLAWRTAQGRPETRCINWGIWSQVGRGLTLEKRGYASIPPAEGVAALDRIIAYGRRRTCYNPSELTDWLGSFATLAEMSFFSDVIAGAAGGGRETGEPTSPLVALRSAPTPDRRHELLRAQVVAQLAAILRINVDMIGPDTALSSIGLDSLMGLELRIRLERDLETPIPRIVVWTSPTVEALSEAILTHLEDHLSSGA
ncbi:type I polyketide synthase [Streptomyces natalensis]|uniref:type I polyketide synthase n=1 Tax=Streptomyces natalensis TaxID=68242 RepID=UPI00099DFE0C|nr:type I polyketide synthase [Streptomyces natalensis]